MLPIVGKISLNVSLVLYLINYAPQIIHNKMRHQTAGLSFYFHQLLLFSSITDLIYGIGVHMPWQYRLVSVSAIFYLFTQHIQIKEVIHDRLFYNASCFVIIITIVGCLCLYFFKQSKSLFISFGYLSQIAGWISFFPQIIKNIGSTAALSLSLIYLLIDLFSNICDNVSAWVLSWPMPSKLGALFSTLICLVLIYQLRIARRKLDNE
ncbi:MAG: PQ-loop repeat-containing protein [Gammaproteobacteria bacterium]|nr:PQ-loop repeat-containing protein [Gammaproteobacteria bacterium]